MKRFLFCFFLLILSVAYSQEQRYNHKTKEVKEMLEKVNLYRDTLANLVARNLAAGLDISKERVSVGVWNIFLNYFLPKSLEKENIFEIKNNIDYLCLRAQLLSQQMEREYFLGRVAVIKNFKTLLYKIKDGVFVSDLDSAPIIYTGIANYEEFVNDLQTLHDCGFNVIYVKISPKEIFPKEKTENYIPLNQVVKILEVAEKYNISVVVSLSLNSLPEWMYTKNESLHSYGSGSLPCFIEDSSIRGFIKKFLSVVIPKMKGKPALHSYFLEENAFCDDDHYGMIQERFRVHLRKIYKTIDKLNNCWGTKYKKLDDINISKEVVKDEKTPVGLKYDWLTFRNVLFANFFEFVKQEIRKYDKKTPLCIATLPDVFEETEYFCSIDVEKISRFCEIYGIRSFMDYKYSHNTSEKRDKDYKFPLEEYMLYDFFKSIGEDKPIFCSDDYLLNISSFPQYISPILWQRALHCHAAQVSFYNLSPNTDMENMELLGHTTLYLKKLVRYINLLNRQKSPFAIFFSNTTKVLSPRHVQTIKKIYQGLYFSGFPIKFITEQQVLFSDKLKDYKILFLPAAEYLPSKVIKKIKEFVISGGILICIGDNMLYDEHGRPHKVEWLKKTILGKGGIIKYSPDMTAQKYASLFDELLDNFKDIRIINYSSGNMVWRYVKDGDRKVCFFVNLSECPLSFRVRSRSAGVTGLRYIFRSGVGIAPEVSENISYHNDNCYEIGVTLSEYVVLGPLETAIVELIEY
jgi:hypothetical protein